MCGLGIRWCPDQEHFHICQGMFIQYNILLFHCAENIGSIHFFTEFAEHPCMTGPYDRIKDNALLQ